MKILHDGITTKSTWMDDDKILTWLEIKVEHGKKVMTQHAMIVIKPELLGL